jgi:hypothetical protein
VIAASSKHPPYKWILGLPASIFAALLLLLFLVPHEPWCKFHRLSYWVDRVEAPDGEQEQARAAIRQIGPKGVPYLFKRLRKLEGQRRRTVIWAMLPGRVQAYVSPPAWDLPNRTEFELSLLGPAIIPQLLAAVHDPNSDVQVVALRALGLLGPKASTTLPTLLQSLAHTNGNVRLASVFAISQMGTIRTQAIPALITALHDSNRGPNGDVAYVREAAAGALGEIGPEAKAAVPDLNTMLGDREPYAQGVAGLALWRITHDTNWISRFTAQLQNATNAQEYRTYLDLLALIGPQAKSAVPTILAGITNFQTEMSRPVSAALRRIDPDSISKLTNSMR